MKNENIVNITGYVYQFKTFRTKNGKLINTFGLQIFNGKSDGKNVYKFINVKMFGKMDNIRDKTKVLITGSIFIDSYKNKDGKNVDNVVVLGNSIKKDENSYNQNDNSFDDNSVGDINPSDIGDDIPF